MEKQNTLEPEYTCPLCGGDMRLMMISTDTMQRCTEHGGVPICGTCNTCTSVEPTEGNVAECRARREVWETIVAPIIKGVRNKLRSQV